MIRRTVAAVAVAAGLASGACGANAPTPAETAMYVRVGASTLAQIAALVAELLEAIDAAKSDPPTCAE